MGPRAALTPQPKPHPCLPTLSPFPEHPWSIKGAAGGHGMAGIHLAAPLQGAGTGAGRSVPTAELGLSSSLAPGPRPPTATQISRAGHCSSTRMGHEKAGRGLALQTPSSHIPFDPVKSHQHQRDILRRLSNVKYGELGETCKDVHANASAECALHLGEVI